LPNPGQSQRRQRQHRRTRRSVAQLAALSLAIAFAACNRQSASSPTEIFNAAHAAFLRGDLGTAHREASAAIQNLADKDPVWSWKFRLLDADVLLWQGSTPQLLQLLNDEPPSQLNTDPLNAKRHMLRAISYSRLGQFPQADIELSQAKNICSTDDCEFAGELARTSGVVALNRDDVDTATQYFRKSLQIARDRHDGFAESTALLNLCWVSLGERHYDESIEWANLAFASAKKLDARQIMEKASGNRGWAYYKMGDFDRALAQVSEAEEGAAKSGLVIDQVEWLNNHGLIYFQLGQLDLAEKFFRKSFDLVQATQNRTQIVDALNSLSYVMVETGQLAEAKNHNDQAVTLTRDINDRMSELPTLLIRGMILARSGDPGAQNILTDVAADSKSDPSVRWEAENELAKLAEREGRLADAAKSYVAAIGIVEKARGQLQHEDSRLPFMANAAHLYDDYIRFLIKQGKNDEALRAASYSRAQTLTEGLEVHQKSAMLTSNFDPRLAAHQQNATILFYWLGARESYLWAITPQQIRLFPLPASASIAEQVSNFRKVLTGPRDPIDSGRNAGVSLYETLVKPARALLPANARVIVVPDAGLNTLNFESLIVPDPTPHYWIEDATILNASSLQLLASGKKPPSKPSLLLLGNALVPSGEYAPLPNAGDEISRVRNHFTPSATTLFAKEQATPVAYLSSRPEQFSYLHFVAHGTASQLTPLDSAVVLSRATSSDDSFKLYAREIVKHPLRAELVTISACYGAGSRTYTGEGLVGLSWAFLRAGAHNVIGALWEVSDASTPQLMDKMYAEIANGKSPDEALRAAKLSLLHSDGVFRKPFYWAPFQLYTGS